MPETTLADLRHFHPLVREWFPERVGTPTAVQAAAWPAIADGRHVLVTAPTGSGKTLTAFLCAIDDLLRHPGGPGPRVLYISPLKALNNDIRRNLLQPLDQLRELFVAHGESWPDIRVLTRSGDTPQNERRAMLRKPLDILITTPESLNLLLNSPQARDMLSPVRTVILDEIHAVAGTKRGAHLIGGIERLVRQAGEFQRVALSATVTPLERIAAWVGGFTPDDHQPREVECIAAGEARQYELAVEFPEVDPDALREEWFPAIAQSIRRRISHNRSTLVFCNARRMAEKVALLLNHDLAEPLAYAHHGSLSRETREVVEARLKAGELRAIVATGTLELGIDVGALDEVVLVETPFDVAAAIQRVGRASHQVGAVSRGTLFPIHGRDFVQAAALCRALENGDLEPLRTVDNPLDVLAQQIVAMASLEPWQIDRLYDFLRCAYPYRELPRQLYEDLLEMLAGRYADTRLPSLQPMLRIDRLDRVIDASDGAMRRVYLAGGTIPDRGYFAMRHEQSRSKIGELDEEFVWERKVGDKFTFGTQTWRIAEINDNDVLVTPTGGQPGIPFWRAESYDRGSHFATRIAEFLEFADTALDEPGFKRRLMESHHLSPESAAEVERYLRRQRGATGTDLPHRHHLLAEYLPDDELGSEVTRILFHTLWGGALNRPFGLALSSAWEQECGVPLEVHTDNDSVVVMAPTDIEPAALLAMVAPEQLDDLVRASLGRSGFFGARFRESAGRAMLLTRGSFRQRMPLWLNRARSKKLLEAVADFPEFPLLAETYRTCLDDAFEMDTLTERLTELRDGEIRLSTCRPPEPSPFAEGVMFAAVSKLMYLDDEPTGRAAGSLIREAVFDGQLRPSIPEAVIEPFRRKLQRTWPGYTPRDAAELLELVKDRLLIPAEDWNELLHAIGTIKGSGPFFGDGSGRHDEAPDGPEKGPDPFIVVAEAAPKLARLRPPAATVESVLALENAGRIAAALDGNVDELAWTTIDGEPLQSPTVARRPADPERDPLVDLLGQWLQFEGPVALDRLPGLLGLDPGQLSAAVDALVEAERAVVDRIAESATGPEICDADNLELLLRLHRRRAAPSFTPLPAERLPLYLAHLQRLTRRGQEQSGLQDALDPLFAYGAPAELWETEILPTRVADYRPEMLDSLLQTSTLGWLGCGKQQLAFVFPDQLPIVQPEHPGKPASPVGLGRHAYAELLEQSDEPAALVEALWKDAWRGRVTNDTFAAVRRGLDFKFQLPPASARRPSRHDRWSRGVTEPGNWSRPPEPPSDEDAVDELERQKESVRLLLDRYGILFRDLLTREVPHLRWGYLFRAMRLMELAGELVAGQFYEGVDGLQFTSPQNLGLMLADVGADAIYWLNATDPASCCGLGIHGLDDLPERRASNLLVYHGAKLVIIARRSGKALDILVPPEDPRLPEYLQFLGERQRRAVQPVGTQEITEINGGPADRSGYVEVLRSCYRINVGYRKVTVWRQPL